MRKRVLLLQLRRVLVTGFLVLAIALNVCELPVHGHAHVAESPVAPPRGSPVKTTVGSPGPSSSW